MLCGSLHCPAVEHPAKNEASLGESLQGNRIECDDITADGVVSAYTEPSFSIENDDEASISDYNWKFSLKDHDGNYAIYSISQAKTWTLPEISSPESFLVNPDGMLEGMIECDYTMDGKSYYAQSVIFNIDLRPIILSVDNIVMTAGEEYTYTISFTVKYKGSNKVDVALYEEFNGNIRRTYYNQPDSANVSIERVDQLGMCWVNIKAENSYGVTKKLLSFPVYYNTDNSFDETAKVEVTDVTYTYRLKEMIGKKPVFNGTMVITIKTEEAPTRIIAMRTLPYQEEGTRIFYSVKYEVPDVDGRKEVKYTFENIDWGTYISAQAFFADNSPAMAQPIYSTNYLSEEDRLLVDEYRQASISDAQTDNEVTISPLGVESNCAEQGIVDIFNLQGILVSSYILTPYGSVDFTGNAPQALILRIKFPHKTITKKLIK